MRCIHRSVVAMALFFVGASTASAQTATTPDTTKVATLATVTVSAESGTWFTRADGRRTSVITAMAENRRLAGILREHDEQAMRLALRLDSLKRIEFVQKVAIAAIDDSVAATRARRRALEARLLAAEAKVPQPW